MAGSRKGEKRGAAKGLRSATPAVPSNTNWVGAKKSGRNEPLHHLTDAPKEAKLYELLTDKKFMRLKPKEAMLQAMNYAFDMAEQWMMVKQENEQQSLLNLQNKKARKTYEEAVDIAETKVMQYLQAGCNWASQAAPYFHPRLVAVANSGKFDDAGPFAAIRSILDEVAQRERMGPLIDHDPQENAQNA